MLKTMLCSCKFTEVGYDKEYLCELNVTSAITSLVNTESMYDSHSCLCAVCEEEESPFSVYCIEVTDDEGVHDIICCYYCAKKLFGDILDEIESQYRQEEVIQEEPVIIEEEPTVEEEPQVLDSEEQEEIKRTIKESIMHFGYSFVKNIDDLIAMDNYSYTNSLLTSIKNHALKLERNSALYNKLLDSFKTIKEKKESTKEDKEKENKLANLLKSIVKGACEICKQILIATGKSATSVCVLLSKIVAYTTTETLGTVKAIGGHYHDAFNKTMLGRKVKERKVQRQKDFDALEDMMNGLSI